MSTIARIIMAGVIIDFSNNNYYKKIKMPEINVSIWGQTPDQISTGDQILWTVLTSVLGGHPVLSGHLAIPWGWPLNTSSTLHAVPGRIGSQSKLR